MSPTIIITVANWDSFNPRKDIKKPSWFRLENSFLTDPEFFNFDCEERMIWIAILCQASQKNKGEVKINKSLLSSLLRVSPDKVESSIEKLIEIEVISVTTRTRNVGVTCAYASDEVTRTNSHATGRDGTGRTGRDGEGSVTDEPVNETIETTYEIDTDTNFLDPDDFASPEDLESLWNEIIVPVVGSNRFSIPKAENDFVRSSVMTSLKQFKLKSEWKKYFQLIAKSDWHEERADTFNFYAVTKLSNVKRELSSPSKSKPLFNKNNIYKAIMNGPNSSLNGFELNSIELQWISENGGIRNLGMMSDFDLKKLINKIPKNYGKEAVNG